MPTTTPSTNAATPSPKSLYDFQMKDLSGKVQSLSDFKGKIVLVVNVASRCGLTPQYAGLQALHDEFQAQGFTVIGFPANNFLGQEPGTNEEIADFCSVNYKVTFPMFSKISVKGDDSAPLYRWLTETQPHAGEIKWNFHKFLIGRNGEKLANIDPRTEPSALRDQIKALLK